MEPVDGLLGIWQEYWRSEHWSNEMLIPRIARNEGYATSIRAFTDRPCVCYFLECVSIAVAWSTRMKFVNLLAFLDLLPRDFVKVAVQFEWNQTTDILWDKRHQTP